MADSNALPEDMQKLVDDAIERMRQDQAAWAFSLGMETLNLLEGAWAAGILEAYECGHLHDAARDEMLARNPYRPKEESP